MTRPLIVAIHPFLPEGTMPRWEAGFPDCDFVDGRQPETLTKHLAKATITYGVPPLGRLQEAAELKWIQLCSAGVPLDLCPPAQARGIKVTNLAGLYGPTIAEHALGLMLIVSRNLQVVLRNQGERRWDRSVAGTMADLHGKTLGIVGLGNIGQNIARLGKAFGMRVVGVRRTARMTPYVDRLYPLEELRSMLAEPDYLAVAAPLTRHTEGMLGHAEFQATRPGVRYINVSRGPVAQEPALLAALQSGHVAAAGLDVFTTEPLPPDHPFWSMAQVVVSPHFSGETVNNSALPAERFARNLRSWLAGREMEGPVNLDLGY